MEEVIAHLRGDSTGAAGSDIDEGPFSAGADEQTVPGNRLKVGGVNQAVLRWPPLAPVEAGDLVGAEGAGTGHGFGPGANLEQITLNGGLEKIDLVAAGDEDAPVLAEAGGGPAGGCRVLDGGFLQVGQEDGVIDVSERVELVEANADGEQEDAARLRFGRRHRA